MKIIVTGGTGFLGRHLVWHLAADGHDVVFTGRRLAEAELVSGASARPVQFVQLDHGTGGALGALRECSKNADAMVHCAALASPWGTREAFQRANVDSTHEALVACQANGIAKLVHISSPSVYFEYRDRLGIREDEPLPAGVNEYARSKGAAEQLVLAAELPHRVILRPRAIFGPWDNALLPRLLRLIRYGRIPLLRGGRALLDMTYIDNVVDAVRLAMALPPAAAPHTFNISNGEPITAADLFAQIAHRFGILLNPVHRPYALADIVARALEMTAQMTVRLAPHWEPPFTRYSLATIAFSQTLDLSRAREVLGYRPRVTLDEGIARTAQWWLQREQSA